MNKCNVCGSVTRAVMVSAGRSVTSLGRIMDGRFSTRVCDQCSHAQKDTSIDLAAYYRTEYKTLSSSADEDDLYGIRDGRPVYRNAHMAETLIETVGEVSGDVLDFGCGKSLVMSHVVARAPDARVHLFDVSRDYVSFWDTFVPRDRQACFEMPADWADKFPLVTSFFALEHVPDPVAQLRAMRRVLAPDGRLYVIVPDMYSVNVADMVVIDHVQHYSDASMAAAMAQAGLQLDAAHHDRHAQAVIYEGSPVADGAVQPPRPASGVVAATVSQCEEIAAHWEAFRRSVRAFEEAVTRAGIARIVILGAGIVGTQAFLHLREPDSVMAFADSNPHKQAKGWQGLPVIPPAQIPRDGSTAVIAGFNADQAERLLPEMVGDLPEDLVWSVRDANPVAH